MGNPRDRRIQGDFQKIISINKKSDLIYVQPLDMDHNLFQIIYRCTGLARDRVAGGVVEVNYHALELYLHKDYPRRPPRLRWQTDIFHPNILSHQENGGVCIGKWTPMEALDELLVRIGEMVQYKQYNLKDVLNVEAGAWAKQNLDRFPVDKRMLIKQPTGVPNEKIVL